jgi:hypothetical protein
VSLTAKRAPLSARGFVKERLAAINKIFLHRAKMIFFIVSSSADTALARR